ncbi:MAG TPA: thiamine diphosphokinase [Anaerolineaceae bacterium]
MPEEPLKKRAVIFANGVIEDIRAAGAMLRHDDCLIAADGGLRHLRRLGLTPAVLIGDLDSVDPQEIPILRADGVDVLRYPVDKDETDLELALDYALKGGFHRLVVAGGLGGRLDQTLGNLCLLTAGAFQDVEIRLDDGREEVFFVRSSCEITGLPGDTLSLIPWGEPVTGIVTSQMRYPLKGETLFPDHTRGISNVMLAEQAAVEIASGLLMVIHTRFSDR